MSSYKIIWTGDKETLERADMLMSEIMYPSADALSLSKNDPIEEDKDTGWQLAAYYSDTPDQTAIAAFIKEHGIQMSDGTFEELPDQDWVAHALEGLGIVQAGRFVLYGIHDEDRLPTGDHIIPIRIDANQAFGTGHHPTTAGCLEMLDRLSGLNPKNVLDLGAGSAVLSIAAAKMWGTDILATDIDPPSVAIAAENATFNDVTGIVCIEADGFDHADITARAPFDFIFANILAGPLKELSRGMADVTTKGATVILAGLLEKQEQGVTQAYEQAGFILKDRLAQDTWPVLVFERT